MWSDAILSPPDSRDYTAGAALEVSGAALPPDFEVWQPPTVENQGATGNCVAQALANIMECIEHQRTGKHRDYSVGYIYGTPLSTSPSSGMYPREACKALHKEGDVLRSVWECYDENPLCREKRAELPQVMHDKAKRIKGYIRLNTKEEMQRYMLKYQLPVMIVAKGSAYWALAGSGNHATVCYGWLSRETYDREYGYGDYHDLRYTNSWGAWDAKGTIKYEELTEIWGVIPMEDIKLIDIDGHWAQKFIEKAQAMGLVQGYEDNTFLPDRQITRAETAKLVVTLADQLLDDYSQLNDRIKRLENMFGLQPM